MRILLLNQFVPPEPPPTARLLGDLAQALRGAGHEVECIGAGSGYGALRGVRRLLRDLKAHLRIAWQVLTAGRCDWVVSFSDPPGLPVTAWILARLKRARLSHWAMDVYPQVAVALGAVKPGLISRLLGAGMSAAYRGSVLLVALDADMAAEIQRVSGRIPDVLPPWPPSVAGPDAKAAREGLQPAAERPGRTWLYSGNLGRAHDFETLLEAQLQIEQAAAPGCWRLRFQGGGPGRPDAEAVAAQLGLQFCDWTGYADDEDLLKTLLEADVLIATQKTVTRGLLWPSKLALMKHLGRPMVWVGPAKGATADLLRGLGVPVVVVEPGDAAGLAAGLQTLPPSPPPPSTARIAERVAAERQAGLRWWVERLSAPAP